MKDDHFIDAALRENARLGTQDDEQFITDLEARIDAKTEATPQANFQFRYLAASAAILILGLGAFLLIPATQKKPTQLASGDITETAFSEELTILRSSSIQKEHPSAEQSTSVIQSRPVGEALTGLKKDQKKHQDEPDFPKKSSAHVIKSKQPLLSSSAPSEFNLPTQDPESAMLLKRESRPIPSKAANQNQYTSRKRAQLVDEFDFRIKSQPRPSDRYAPLIDKGFLAVEQAPLSTFSIDVDTASYTNARKIISTGGTPHPNSVRIEEMINYFHYDYPQPSANHPIGIHTEVAACPWNTDHRLVKVGLQAKAVKAEERKAANLVFLIDVSGSMSNAEKLPLLTDSFQILLNQLNEEDRVSLVVYAGRQAILMQPTSMDAEGRATARKTLTQLRSGGGTNGAAGITTAYKLAHKAFRKNGVNRIILATDGDFNVGISSTDALVKLAKKQAAEDIYLTVLGFGRGNLNDALMETLSNDANGNYFYLDSLKEAQKVFQHQIAGTLETVAKDTKIQVEFNPTKVASYRLIGYVNRRLKDEDFTNDQIDAGDVGAGHQVTALYEVIPVGVATKNKVKLKYQPSAEPPSTPHQTENSDELLTVSLRYKLPGEDTSELLSHPLIDQKNHEASPDFKFSSSVALWGMLLRNSPHLGTGNWDMLKTLAAEGTGPDPRGHRIEFRDLVRKTAK